MGQDRQTEEAETDKGTQTKRAMGPHTEMGQSDKRVEV